MRTYAISEENTVSAYEREPPASGGTMVRSYEDLLCAAQSWPGQRLIEVWNNLAASTGGSPVRKFENRTIGAQRVWRALQSVPAVDPEPRSKKQLVVELMQRSSGASLEELMSATGWQAHSMRGFISTHKAAYGIQRFARDEDHYAYRAAKPDDTLNRG